MAVSCLARDDRAAVRRVVHVSRRPARPVQQRSPGPRAGIEEVTDSASADVASASSSPSVSAAFASAASVLEFTATTAGFFAAVSTALADGSTTPLSALAAGSAAFGIALVYYISKYAVMQSPVGPFIADARTIGITLFEAYIFPFEMVSILLLAAIVGALVLSARGVQSS